MLSLSSFKERTLNKYKSKIVSFDKFNIFFASLVLFQFVTITLFQSLLSFRNYGLNAPLNVINFNCRKFKPALPVDYMDYFAVENYLFIAYQLFLLYLGLNSIFNRYVLQLCAYSILNFGGYIYVIVQITEMKTLTEYVRNECLTPDITKGNDLLESFRLNYESTDPKMLRNDLPQFIAYTFFAMLTGYLTLKTYSQIGFNNYYQKKIGIDNINNSLLISILQKQLLYKFLLKFFIYFTSTYFVFCIYFFLTYLTLKNYMMTIVVLIFIIVFILILRLTRLAFIYVDEEYTLGMTYFLYLWIFVLFNTAILCVIGVGFIPDKWYFLLPYNIIYLIVSLVTYISAFKVKDDFGKGLKEAIENNKRSKLQSVSNNETNEISIKAVRVSMEKNN